MRTIVLLSSTTRIGKEAFCGINPFLTPRIGRAQPVYRWVISILFFGVHKATVQNLANRPMAPARRRISVSKVLTGRPLLTPSAELGTPDARAARRAEPTGTSWSERARKRRDAGFS